MSLAKSPQPHYAPQPVLKYTASPPSLVLTGEYKEDYFRYWGIHGAKGTYTCPVCGTTHPRVTALLTRLNPMTSDETHLPNCYLVLGCKYDDSTVNVGVNISATLDIYCSIKCMKLGDLTGGLA